jgi:hypothetical protein
MGLFYVEHGPRIFHGNWSDVDKATWTMVVYFDGTLVTDLGIIAPHAGHCESVLEGLHEVVGIRFADVPEWSVWLEALFTGMTFGPGQQKGGYQSNRPKQRNFWSVATGDNEDGILPFIGVVRVINLGNRPSTEL